MRTPLLFAIAAALSASGAARGAQDRPMPRVVARDARGVTVEFLTGTPVVQGSASGPADIFVRGYTRERLEGRPVLPVRRFLVEVPHDREVTIESSAGSVSPVRDAVPLIPGADRAPAGSPEHRAILDASAREGGGAFADLVSVETMRGRRVALVDVRPVLWDPSRGSLVHAARIVVRLSWREAAEPERPAAPAPEDRFVIDAGAWSRGGEPGRSLLRQRTPFEFARSDAWLRLSVPQRGLYRVAYEDLVRAGLDPSSIDPATVRLFTGGPLRQPDSVGQGGSYEEGWHLSELAIRYEGSNTGMMMPGESFLFYGAAAADWRNVIDPSAPADQWYEHRYDDEAVCWMTWGGAFADAPLRMDARDAAPPGSFDLDVSTYRHRLRVESDLQYDPAHTDDSWYWRRMNTGTTVFSNTFQCTGVAGGSGTLRTVGYGPPVVGNSLGEAECSVNGETAGTMQWVPYSFYSPDTLAASLTSLRDGTNTFTVVKPSDDVMYIQWYEIAYDRRLRSDGGRLDFFSPAAAGAARFSLEQFPVGEDLVLLDVTDWTAPVLLTGWTSSDGGTSIDVRFGDALAGSPRHYHAAAESGLLRPGIEIASLAAGILPSLRDEPAAEMVIIHHRSLRSAALRLQAHRLSRLPHVAAPRVRAVDIEDVYANFSGGMKDPIAVRNYLKFLYDTHRTGGEPVLRYVLLLGNCTYDPRDILGRGNDLVPTYINTKYEREGIEDDDFLAKLDPGPDRLIDVAIGRMPVLTAADAGLWVGRIIRYESGIDLGPWRNKVVIVADDEHSTSTDNDFYFTVDAEWMSVEDPVFPGFVDIRKIYLHDYPFVGNLKPGARTDLLDEWREGALVVNYAGHGSPLQLADERVMQMSDLYTLTNGARAPLFLAFSCTVGDLESPYHRSMGQEVTVLEDGGAIAVIAGVAPTILVPNRELNYLYFDYLFATKDSTVTEPVGGALMMAKTDVSIERYTANNAKYALLGDPALTLALPALTVEHDAARIDTMETGYRYTVAGSVLRSGGVDVSFDGTADVVVQESMEMIADPIVWWGSPRTLEYRLPGKDLFRGSVEVTAGRFSAEFVVPIRCRTGPRARVRSYLAAGTVDAAGALDTLKIVAASVLPVNSGPPKVDAYFSGEATRVKPGALLITEISDEEGVAILGTDPQSSIFLEFDRSGYPIFVTDYFRYDHGSSTTGRIEYPLHAGFEPGEHSVIVRAFDNLGAGGSDTLRFEVIEEGLFAVTDVFNMPNPLRDSTNFIFQLSSPATVTLRLYTVSGTEIWSHHLAAEEGFNSVWWDGRDWAGDRVANGTYLYVIEVSFRDSYHRAETVTGKVVVLR